MRCKAIISRVAEQCTRHPGYEALYVASACRPSLVIRYATGGRRNVFLDKDIFAGTVKCRLHTSPADPIVLAHNHPNDAKYLTGSDWSWVSWQDFNATSMVMAWGHNVVEHYIINQELGLYVSMRELFTSRTLQSLRQKRVNDFQSVPGIIRCIDTLEEASQA